MSESEIEVSLVVRQPHWVYRGMQQTLAADVPVLADASDIHYNIAGLQN